MMRYIPLTDADRIEMMKTVGIQKVDDLFRDIPAEFRLSKPLKIPPAMSECDLMRHAHEMMSQNSSCLTYPCFLGAGAYRHFIPTIVNALASRGEFLTAYTPYQPEISQGTLQGIFEYQTLMSQLTGLPVSNASLYDGAMATAEAALMACRVYPKQKSVLVSKALHPAYRQTLATYTGNQGIRLIEIPLGQDGRTDAGMAQSLMSETPAAVIIQSPNFLGVIEDWARFAQLAPGKTLLIAVVTEAISMGILNPPGYCGADIACGEAQSLGLPVSFGGPYLGFFTTKESFMRHMPGRLVGQTRDTEGRTGYVNTLSTREQHIRREKATSNICTNQAWCAMTAGIYMSMMGKQGLRETALQNIRKSAYLKSRVSCIHGYRIRFETPTFNEFVVEIPGEVAQFNAKLAKTGIIGGLDLTGFYPELGQSILLCATEMTTREDIDRLVEFMQRWSKEVQS